MTQIAPSIAPTPFTLPTLFDYQKPVVEFAIKNPFCGLFLRMGAGKTLSVLYTLACVQPAGHILIIAPKTIARSTWIDEIENHGFPLRMKSLLVDENDRELTPEARKKAFAQIPHDPPTMYFINKELLTMPSQPRRLIERQHSTAAPVLRPTRDATEEKMLNALEAIVEHMDQSPPITREELIAHHASQIVVDDKGKTKKRHTKRSIESAITALIDAGTLKRIKRACERCSGNGCRECSDGLIDQLPVVTQGKKKVAQWPFATVIIDESQSFKNPSSARFKALARVRPAISRLIELTGTPAPNGLLDLWSQIYLLDQGAALGKTMTEYKQRYFMVTRTMNGRPIEWKPQPGAEKAIYDAINHLVISIDDDALRAKLPPELPVNDIYVHLDKDEQDAYRDFLRQQVMDLVDDDGKTVTLTAESGGALRTKLLQFASGTLYVGPEKKFAVIHEHKLEMCDYLLRNAPSPTILAYRFQAEGRHLHQRLHEMGHDVQTFDGSRQMKKDWNDRKIPVMLLQPASAGHGLNLQFGGSNLIWHTLPESLEQYEQTNARLLRPGQTDPVSIHRIMTAKTYDKDSPARLANKARVQQDLIEAIQYVMPTMVVTYDEEFDDRSEMLGF